MATEIEIKREQNALEVILEALRPLPKKRQLVIINTARVWVEGKPDDG